MRRRPARSTSRSISVLLMHASEGRCYSVAEMEGYLSAAGFSSCAYVSGAAARGIMTARK